MAKVLLILSLILLLVGCGSGTLTECSDESLEERIEYYDKCISSDSSLSRGDICKRDVEWLFCNEKLINKVDIN